MESHLGLPGHLHLAGLAPPYQFPVTLIKNYFPPPKNPPVKSSLLKATRAESLQQTLIAHNHLGDYFLHGIAGKSSVSGHWKGEGIPPCIQNHGEVSHGWWPAAEMSQESQVFCFFEHLWCGARHHSRLCHHLLLGRGFLLGQPAFWL